MEKASNRNIENLSLFDIADKLHKNRICNARILASFSNIITYNQKMTRDVLKLSAVIWNSMDYACH